MIKFLKYIPFQLTFFLIFGILTGRYINFSPLLLTAILCFLLALFTTVYFYANKLIKPPILFTVLTFGLVFLLGIGTFTFKNNLHNNLHYSKKGTFNTSHPVEAVISLRKVLKPNSFYMRYEAVVKSLDHQKATGKILVYLEKKNSTKEPEVDDTFLVKTSFFDLPKPLNPHSFNYKQYLENQHINHQIYLKKGHFKSLSVNEVTLKGFAASFRKKVNLALISSGFQEEELSVVNALLLGQRQGISKELMQQYSEAGAVHILAVSGLHVGIILLLLMVVFKPLHYIKHGKLIAYFLIIMVLWAYAVIAGLSASVVRAVTMFTAIAAGMYVNRPSNTYNALVISMFFLLLFHPGFLFEVGFQLSYLAVFFIVWIQPKLAALWNPKWWLLQKFWQLFTVSMAAQLGVLPLSLYYFHYFPGLFFVSNLVIIPFLGAVLMGGVIVIILSLAGSLPQVMSEMYQFVIQQLNAFVGWVAAQDFFIIRQLSFSLSLMLVVYLGIICVFKWYEKRNFHRLILMLSSVILIQMILFIEKYQLESVNEFVVFQKYKKSIIGKRKGAHLQVIVTDSADFNNDVINAYITGVGIESTDYEVERGNLIRFHAKDIVIVDSLGVYNYTSVKPAIVLLQHTPKINLERMINQIKPKLIIADGSNYSYYLERWEETCRKNKTPFYNTVQKGAFLISQ